MTNWSMRAAAALLGVLLAPVGAQAAEKVAVLPVQIMDADPGNGERMTEALAVNLTHHGSKVVDIAENLAETAWRPLKRPGRDPVKTQPRQRPDNVKDRVVKEREYETLRLQSEEVAEFNDRQMRPH